MKYLILSVDGGGVRGLIPVILMQRLAEELGQEWYNDADFYAGTSTGGLIALGLAQGIPLQTIHDLYTQESAGIFAGRIHADKVVRADYRNNALTRQVKKLFEDHHLGDYTKRVLVTSFDFDNGDPISRMYSRHGRSRHGKPPPRRWKAKMFHNFPGKDSDADALAYKVALYTSAAPTYFPTVDGFVDGGMLTNNPSMCALAQTQDTRIRWKERPKPELQDIVLLSFGTGEALRYHSGSTLNWGYLQWGKPILDILLDGVSGMVADFQCHQLLHGNYQRVQLQFPGEMGLALDSAKQLDQLRELTETLDAKRKIRKTVKWLRDVWLSDNE